MKSTEKIAVITGGSSGIGFATALMLVKKGWTVVVADKNSLPDFGADKMYCLSCDVSQSDSVKNVFCFVKEKFGRLDFLMTSAGVHLAKPAWETSEEEYDRLFDVNMKGTFLVTVAAVPLMESTGDGCIVTVSSDAGLIPDKDAVLYSATKHAIVGYSKGLAVTLKREKDIRVNCVCPGATDTPFLRKAFGDDLKAIEECGKVNPMGRLAEPEEIAQVVIQGILENPYINGAVWNVDGGYSWDATSEPEKS